MPRSKPPKKSLPSTFDTSYLAHVYTSPTDVTGFYAWDLGRIRRAREAHMRGEFYQSARLAEAMKTDPAIFASLLNRIAPSMGLERVISTSLIKPSKRIRNEAAVAFGKASPSLSLAALADAFEGVAMMGVQVLQNRWEVRDDGSRVDVFIEPWPMDTVMLDPTRKQLVAITTEGPVDIVHGDGKWVVASLHHDKPWLWGAIVPLAMLWPDRAYGTRDRSQNAEAHGQGKPVGTLPKDVLLDSQEGKQFAAVIRRLNQARSGLIKPYGSELEYLESSSQAWQIFKEIISSDNSDIAKVLLGQDGTVNNSGGNYIKSDVLFGVRNDIVEGDLRAMQYAINTGVLRPWTSINFGDPDQAPTIEWPMPDADEDARVESLGKRTAAFNQAVRDYRANGFVVDQSFIDELAEKHSVIAPVLAESAPTRTEISAYEVDGGVFTINELRVRKGLPEVPWGNVTVPQRQAELAERAKEETEQ